MLASGDALKHADHILRLNPTQIETLATRKNRHRHFANFSRSEDEFDVGGWLFQRL